MAESPDIDLNLAHRGRKPAEPPRPRTLLARLRPLRTVRALLLLLLAVAFVPVLVVQGLVYRTQFESRQQQEFQANRELARASALAFEAFVQDVLHQEAAIGRAIAGARFGSPEEINTFLQASAREYWAVRDYAWIAPSGRVVYASLPAAIGATTVGERPYYQEIVQGRDWVVSDLAIAKTSGLVSFHILRSIRDGQGGLQGTVLASIDPGSLGKVLATERAGGASVSLLDRQGMLVYRYPEVERGWQEREWLRQDPTLAGALAGQESTSIVVGEGGMRRIAARAPVRSLGWVVQASRPEAEVMAPVVEGLRRDVGLTLLVAVASSLAALVVARRLTSPLRRLRRQALNLARGRPDGPMLVEGPVELEELGEAFEQMSREISVRERAFKESEARYRTLFEAERAAHGEARAARRAHEEHLARLDRLIGVSSLVLAEATMEGLLRRVVDAARELTGARLGVSGHGYRDGVFRVRAASRAEGIATCPAGESFQVERGGVYLELIHKVGSLRLTDEELRSHPGWRGLPEGHGELRGLLGARLVDPGGEANGLIMVSDKADGDFTQEDETLLVQLAAVASLGLHHIQARERAERRASELNTIVGNIADAVFVCDSRGVLTMANGAGMDLLGQGDEGNERPLASYLRALQLTTPHGAPVPAEDLAIARALRGEVVRGKEEAGIHPRTDRRIDLLVSAAPLRDPAGQIAGAVEVVTDVTQLRELDRLKDQFISVAAHELKTPVAIMKGYAQFLLRRPGDVAPERHKMLDAIVRGSDRIDRIVMDLLDVSRLHLGYLEMAAERIDLVEMVEEVVDRTALNSMKHRLRLVKAEPVVVQGDRGRLEQVVVNLIDNALRYSPKGGDVDVEVELRGGEVVLSVTDQGVGIPTEKQPRMFERFYRAHTHTPFDYGGMGVGLYISREIVARHGGRMWFESEEGKGSSFHFSLPLHGRGKS